MGFTQEKVSLDEAGKTRSLSKNVMGLSRYYDQWIVSKVRLLKCRNRKMMN
jgi:hypothetical protein